MHPKVKKNMARNSQLRVPHTQYRSRSAFDSTWQPAFTTARRDIYKMGGYKESLTFDDHFTAYARTFGGAGIKLMPDKAFSMPPVIKEDGSDGYTTQFEKDCQRLVEEYDFWAVCKDLVEFSRVFEYAGVIITAKEQDGNDKTLAQDIGKLRGVDSIVRFDVVMQDQISAEGVPTIEDFSSAKYGMPKYFNYDENVTSNDSDENTRAFELHASRVFTFSETAPPNKLQGTPFNEKGFNYISNCEKVVAAAPEGFIKNARGMTIFNIKDQQIANALKDPNGSYAAKFQEQDEDYHAGINTSRLVGGMDVTQHQISLADPTGTLMANFNLYAMTINTSGSILLGKQEGERASTEDMNKFIEDCKAKQQHTYTPMIKRMLRWLWEMGAITKPANKVIVEWPDLAEPTIGEKVDRLGKLSVIAKANPDFFEDINEVRELAGLEKRDITKLSDFGEDDEIE
ncbi:putative portal protein [Pseudoalteromonas phage C7]|uniref:portal protein n=1 Tax=Pseudoalteromonas phage C7 TaxID=2510494 RepID=UPI0010186FC3|nr:portal protein [Pseudoalteromonas phage C7]QAY18017.1 putative portal protein [Pseudoalteromonas phage C7]